MGVTSLTKAQYEQAKAERSFTVFRYTPNNRGFIFLQVCAALLLIISFVVYLGTGFSHILWGFLSGGLGIGACYLLYLVVRWSGFAKRSAVAFDEDYLYVVTRGGVERIAWKVLSIESSGLDQEITDGNHGTLNMKIEQHEIPLRLFNAFVWIEDFPTFLVELLSQIKANEAESSDQAAIEVDAGATHSVADDGEAEDADAEDADAEDADAEDADVRDHPDDAD